MYPLCAETSATKKIGNKKARDGGLSKIRLHKRAVSNQIQEILPTFSQIRTARSTRFWPTASVAA